jgi:hypothetical protein
MYYATSVIALATIFLSSTINVKCLVPSTNIYLLINTCVYKIQHIQQLLIPPFIQFIRYTALVLTLRVFLLKRSFTVVSEHGPLPKVVWNTIVSDEPEKAHSLDC